MTVTLDRPTGQAPQDLSRKAAPGGQALAVDESEHEGVVTAIVSVTGVRDEVDDVLVPGCYTDTLTKRRPKVVWGHDWNQPIARVTQIEEYRPGDSRLPQRTKDGKPWPADAGALVARMEFNLDSPRGLQAFRDVKFYSESDEAEWSIGYAVPAGKATRAKDGTRYVKAVDLYELSSVLFGAAPLSMTLDWKAAHAAADEDAWTAALASRTDSPASPTPEGDAGGPLFTDEDPPGASSSTLPGEDDDEEDDEPEPVDEEAVAAKALYSPEVKRKFSTDKRRDLAKRGVAMSDGSFPIENREDLRNAIRLAGQADDPGKARAHIRKRARALGLTDLLPDDWADGKALPWWQTPEGKGGVPGVADTPGDRASTRNLTRWYERGEGAAKIRWGEPGDFMRCVRIAGKHMSTEKAKGFCANRHHGALGVWPGQEHGKAATPGDYGVKDSGLSLDPARVSAYDPTAEVGPDAGHARPGVKSAAQGPDEGLWDGAEVEAKAYPFLPGSDEERRELLRRAAVEAFSGEPLDEGDGPPEWQHVEVVATYPSRAIVRREAFRGPHDGQEETYSVPYSITDGTVSLGTPEQVRLEVNANIEQVDDGGGEPEAAPAAPTTMLDALGMLTRSVEGMRNVETKAGRVLSRDNEKHLRGAVESLVAVLRKVGVRVDTADGPDPEERSSKADEADPNTPEGRQDTTSPSARDAEDESGSSRKTVDPSAYARALDVRAFLAERGR